MGMTAFLPQMGITMVLYFGISAVARGDISSGSLASFLLYTLSLAMSFGVISGLYGDFMQAIGASQQVFAILDRLPRIPLSSGGRIAKWKGQLTFENVYFAVIIDSKLQTA